MTLKCLVHGISLKGLGMIHDPWPHGRNPWFRSRPCSKMLAPSPWLPKAKLLAWDPQKLAKAKTMRLWEMLGKQYSIDFNRIQHPQMYYPKWFFWYYAKCTKWFPKWIYHFYAVFFEPSKNGWFLTKNLTTWPPSIRWSQVASVVSERARTGTGEFRVNETSGNST